MKLLQYSTVVKAIAISVALAFSTITFAAEAKTAEPVAEKKDKVTKAAPNKGCVTEYSICGDKSSPRVCKSDGAPLSCEANGF